MTLLRVHVMVQSSELFLECYSKLVNLLFTLCFLAVELLFVNLGLSK